MSRFRRVLLVEDNADDQELARIAFAESGDDIELHVVRDGVEALAFLEDCRRQVPNLVLLDLNLPRLDGIGVLRHLRAMPTLAQVPVVMLSTSDHPDDLRRAYAAGVNSYIVKPVDFTSFLEVVRDLQRYWLHLNCAVA